jgi:hypothetical protein
MSGESVTLIPRRAECGPFPNSRAAQSGLIVTLIGLIAFGGFARGKWYCTESCSPVPQ